MPPKRIVLHLCAMANDENDIIRQATWLAVSAAWYNLYFRQGEATKDRYYHYAVNNGIVFG